MDRHHVCTITFDFLLLAQLLCHKWIGLLQKPHVDGAEGDTPPVATAQNFNGGRIPKTIFLHKGSSVAYALSPLTCGQNVISISACTTPCQPHWAVAKTSSIHLLEQAASLGQLTYPYTMPPPCSPIHIHSTTHHTPASLWPMPKPVLITVTYLLHHALAKVVR